MWFPRSCQRAARAAFGGGRTRRSTSGSPGGPGGVIVGRPPTSCHELVTARVPDDVSCSQHAPTCAVILTKSSWEAWWVLHPDCRGWQPRTTTRSSCSLSSLMSVRRPAGPAVTDRRRSTTRGRHDDVDDEPRAWGPERPWSVEDPGRCRVGPPPCCRAPASLSPTTPTRAQPPLRSVGDGRPRALPFWAGSPPRLRSLTSPGGPWRT